MFGRRRQRHRAIFGIVCLVRRFSLGCFSSSRRCGGRRGHGRSARCEAVHRKRMRRRAWRPDAVSRSLRRRLESRLACSESLAALTHCTLLTFAGGGRTMLSRVAGLPTEGDRSSRSSAMRIFNQRIFSLARTADRNDRKRENKTQAPRSPGT